MVCGVYNGVAVRKPETAHNVAFRSAKGAGTGFHSGLARMRAIGRILQRGTDCQSVLRRCARGAARHCVFAGLLAIAAVALAVRGGLAAPPDFSQAPADARWLVHVDQDALQGSVAYQRIFKAALRQWKPLAALLDRVHERYGIDLAKDLHGLTFFGDRLSQRRAVLVMRARWAAETFRRTLALAGDYSMVREGGYEIHRFTQTDRGQARPITAARWKDDTFVFAPAVEDVKVLLFGDGLA